MTSVVRIVLFVISALLFSTAFAESQGSITSIDDYRIHQKTKQFIGQYLQGTEDGGTDMVNITDTNGYLQVWEPRGFNVAKNTFKIFLDRLGERRVSQQLRRVEGMATVENFHDIQANSAIEKEIITGRNVKSIRTIMIAVSEPYLYYYASLEYYRRRRIFRRGEWVHDTSSILSRNAYADSYKLLKLSNKPLPPDVFFDLITSRPSPYKTERQKSNNVVEMNAYRKKSSCDVSLNGE